MEAAGEAVSSVPAAAEPNESVNVIVEAHKQSPLSAGDKKNVLPFGVHRMVLLVIAVTYAVFTGPHFFNWTVWESVLKSADIYHSLCPAGSGGVCDAQQNAIASILAACTMTMFANAFLAGFVLDYFGPKACCLYGTTIMLLGWTLLTLHHICESLVLVGFCLVGAAVDASFFGMLGVANLFPTRGSTVIAVLGAARSLSNGIPVALEWTTTSGLHLNFEGICEIMIGVAVLCQLTAVFFVPMRPFVKGEKGVHDGNETMAVERSDSISSRIEALGQSLGCGNGSFLVEQAEGVVEPSLQKRSVLVRVRQQLRGAGKHARALGNSLLSPLYLPIVFLTAINLIRNTFFLASASVQLDDTSVSLLTTMNVLAWIPAPIFGYMVDLHGPLRVILIVVVTNLLMMSTLFVAQVTSVDSTQHILRILTVIFAFPGIGFLLSQIYCYIAIVFPPKDMGKLVGLACLIGGLASLICNPVYSWALKHSTFWAVDLAIIIATIACLGIVAFLSRRMEQTSTHQTPQSVTVAENDSEQPQPCCAAECTAEKTETAAWKVAKTGYAANPPPPSPNLSTKPPSTAVLSNV